MTGLVVKPQSAVLCDDIREERNGQLTAVGCLGPALWLDAYPARIDAKIMIIADFQLEGASGSADVELRLISSALKDAGPIYTASISAQQEMRGVLLPSPKIGFDLDRPARVDLEFRNSSADPWDRIMSWSFELQAPD